MISPNLGVSAMSRFLSQYEAELPGNIYYLIFKYESFQEENQNLQNLTNFTNDRKSYNIIINVYNPQNWIVKLTSICIKMTIIFKLINSPVHMPCKSKDFLKSLLFFLPFIFPEISISLQNVKYKHIWGFLEYKLFSYINLNYIRQLHIISIE